MSLPKYKVGDRVIRGDQRGVVLAINPKSWANERYWVRFTNAYWCHEGGIKPDPDQTTELNAASTDDLMSELRRRYPGIVFTFNPAPIGDAHDTPDGQPY